MALMWIGAPASSVFRVGAKRQHKQALSFPPHSHGRTDGRTGPTGGTSSPCSADPLPSSSQAIPRHGGSQSTLCRSAPVISWFWDGGLGLRWMGWLLPGSTSEWECAEETALKMHFSDYFETLRGRDLISGWCSV